MGFRVIMFQGKRRWSKDLVKWELLSRHRSGEDLSWKRTPNGLKGAAAKYYGSYRRAIEAAGLDYESIRRRRPSWSRRAVVRELRKLHAGGMLAQMRSIGKEASKLYRATRSQFKTVAAGMKAAGIPWPLHEPRWSKEKVIEELRRRHRNGGELLSWKAGNALKQAAQRYFGTYGKAMEAAGIEYLKIRQTESWDRERILRELRELGTVRKKLKAERIKARSHGLYEAMIREFGSIAKAAKAAGAAYQPLHNWGPVEIFDELSERVRHGKSISVTDMKRSTPALVSAAKRVFGSYPQAVATLGLKYENVRKTYAWTRERIIEELRRLIESGVKANSTDLQRAHPQLLAATYKYFAGPREALGCAGIEYQRRMQWSKPTIARKLKELASAGEDLSPSAMHKGHGSLMIRAWRVFGSYRKAIEAAGLDYFEVTKRARWDRKGVLRKLRELAARGVDMSYRALIGSHPRIVDAAKRTFGSYPQARVEAGVGPQPLTRWSAEKIVRALRKLQRSGESLAVSRMSKAHAALLDAAGHHFGSYGDALGAAGIEYEHVRLTRSWTNEQLVDELKRLDQKDTDMRSSVLRKLDHGLHMAAYKHFGSYEAALRAAGIDYPPKKPLAGWGRWQVLRRLRELHEDRQDLRYSAMKEKYSALFFAARYYFDAYITAVKRAGLDYERIVREQLQGRKKWRKFHQEGETSGTSGPTEASAELSEGIGDRV